MSTNMKDNVTSLSQEKASAIAQQMGCSLAFAEGYIAGKSERWRGNPPSSYVVVGVDEYALGFRAGYFARKPVGIEDRRSSGKAEDRQNGEKTSRATSFLAETNVSFSMPRTYTPDNDSPVLST